MTTRDDIELEVCDDCTFVLANGSETAEHEAARYGLEKNWQGYEIVNACEDACEGSFSWSPCRGCGSDLGGNRHPAVALPA